MDVLICRICRGGWERCEVGTWLAQCYCDVPFSLRHALIDQEPTPVARNLAVAQARAIGADVLIQVDADMDPSPTFFMRALEFLASQPGAVCIGSPYCGAPPEERVQVLDSKLNRFSRKDASQAKGIGLVGAIGTGLLACNMACFDGTPPYFDYEYTNERHEVVSSTEDFYFSRRLTAQGGRVFCDWDSWSGHQKEKRIDKPTCFNLRMGV